MCIPDLNTSFLSAFNANVGSFHSMNKGFYHFFGELSEYSHIIEGQPYLMAKAASIFEFQGDNYGVVQHFNISNLVSRLSVGYLNGYNRRGDDLIERYNGSLIEKKTQFLEEWIIDYVIEVFQEWDANQVYWRMCDKKNFIAKFDQTRCSAEFKEYYDRGGPNQIIM